MKHFLKETDLQPGELGEVFSLARDFKRKRGRHTPPVLAGQTWALIFAKSSTRTRVSFEVGINELGGKALFLNKNDIQLGRGESIEDTARGPVALRPCRRGAARFCGHGPRDQRAHGFPAPVPDLCRRLHRRGALGGAGRRPRRGAQGQEDRVPRGHELQHGEFLDPGGEPIRDEDLMGRPASSRARPYVRS